MRESRDKFPEDMRDRRVAIEQILAETAADEVPEAEIDEEAGNEAPGPAGPSIRPL